VQLNNLNELPLPAFTWPGKYKPGQSSVWGSLFGGVLKQTVTHRVCVDGNPALLFHDFMKEPAKVGTGGCIVHKPLFIGTHMGRSHSYKSLPYVRINTATPQHLVNKAFHRKTLHV
jgi:hypothetical protein